MSFPTESQVEKILDPYVQDDLVKYFSLEENESTLTLRIDTCEDEFDVHIKIPTNYPQGEYQIKYKKKKLEKQGTLHQIIENLMEIFENQRNLVLEQYGGLDTPETGEEDLIWEIEVENIMQKHVKEVNTFFGVHTCSIIEELDQVRFDIKTKYIPSTTKKLYEINKSSLVFGIQFTADYVENKYVPSLMFKKEFISDNPGMNEQIVNISRRFMKIRWNQVIKKESIFFPEIDLDLKLDKKGQLNHLKKIKEKNEFLAIAYGLFYSNFKREKAANLLTDAGFLFSDAIQDDGNPNVLLELVAYLMIRLETLTKHCLICDNFIEIPFIEDVPTICTRFQCQFDYIEMNICNTIPVTICPISIVSDILENEDIVDLLICMCYSAAHSSRRDKIFTPFPEMFQQKGKPDFGAVEKILSKFPSVSKMQAKCDSEKELKEFLGDNQYQLLRWILTSKRCALLKIPEKKQISDLKTEYQYITLVDDPARSDQFSKHRIKYGSYFAFHGSGVENWHSILRRGLINASNTDLMTSGAAYGSGVYLAEQASTSVGYARTGKGWEKSKFGDTSKLQGMAVCEVVKLPGVPTTPNPYYVVANADAITARFIMFYPSGASLNCTGKQLTDTLKGMILK